MFSLFVVNKKASKKRPWKGSLLNINLALIVQKNGWLQYKQKMQFLRGTGWLWVWVCCVDTENSLSSTTRFYNKLTKALLIRHFPPKPNTNLKKNIPFKKTEKRVERESKRETDYLCQQNFIKLANDCITTSNSFDQTQKTRDLKKVKFWPSSTKKEFQFSTYMHWVFGTWHVCFSQSWWYHIWNPLLYTCI